MRGASNLPAPWIDAARLARRAILRAAGPIDRVFFGTGRRGLPPLWLRRHAGPIAKFSSSAHETMERVESLGLWDPNRTVLDAGCGPGAMPLELQKRLGHDGRYVGFDVHSPSIEWCRKRFADDPRFRFEHLDVRTPYSPRSPTGGLEARFPADDGGTRLTLAKSLFTHILPPESAVFLREIARVLEPGGAALVTAFLFEPGSSVPAFPFVGEGGRLRWRIRNRPHAAVAYSKELFESIVRNAGLRVEARIDGFYPGEGAIPTGQDMLVLRRAAIGSSE